MWPSLEEFSGKSDSGRDGKFGGKTSLSEVEVDCICMEKKVLVLNDNYICMTL